MRRVLIQVVVSGTDAALGAPHLANFMGAEARRHYGPGFRSYVLTRKSRLGVLLVTKKTSKSNAQTVGRPSRIDIERSGWFGDCPGGPRRKIKDFDIGRPLVRKAL